ncbi:MAG: TetR/AcrR family transcriptional regulator [Microcoleaceae cyanobacterium]
MPKIKNYPKSQTAINKAEQILNGAMPEFLRHGYDCTSMDKIAKSAGVSKQTLYSHFCDKDGLFTALVERIASEKFKIVWSQPLQGKPDQVLRSLAQRVLNNINDPEYVCFIRLITAESGKRPDLCEVFLTNLVQPAITHLTQYLESCEELHIKDPEATARIFVGALIHFMMVQGLLQGDKLMPMESDRLIDNLVEMIVNR